MAELRGKGWRVIGYFIWMLGAGVLLDGDTPMMGRVLLVAGASFFLAGAWQSVNGAGGKRE